MSIPVFSDHGPSRERNALGNLLDASLGVKFRRIGLLSPDGSANLRDMLGDPFHAAYVFATCLSLALLEVQIEGPDGWGAKLPTWRVTNPVVLAMTNGKPITGYLVYMNLTLLLFFHFPFAWSAWTWERESVVLAFYALVTVFWDFLYFVVNPHFGLARFRPGQVWWFRKWAFGIPVDYFFGLAVSLAIACSGMRSDVAGVARRWLVTLGVFLGLTAAVGVAVRLRRRPAAL